MIPDDLVRREVIRLVREAAPSSPETMADELVLGRDGLGFDSIRLVELLLACEDRFGVSIPAEMTVDALSIGALVDHIAQRRAG